jgi:hypothetical protein
MSERMIVVSTDCHAGLPIADYKPYVESKYHEMMDMVVPITIDMMDKAESTFLIKDINDAWRAPIQRELTGAWDYKERLNMLAGDGIAAEVIFPEHAALWRWTGPVAQGHGAGTAVGRGDGAQSLVGAVVCQRPRPPHRRGLNSLVVGCTTGRGRGALVCGKRPARGDDSHLVGRA